MQLFYKTAGTAKLIVSRQTANEYKNKWNNYAKHSLKKKKTCLVVQGIRAEFPNAQGRYVGFRPALD